MREGFAVMVYWFYLVFFVIISSFAIAGGEMDNNLVDDILAQGRLGKFEYRDISKLVARYISIGAAKEEAVILLNKNGFAIKEEEREIPGCVACDPIVVIGSYLEKRKFSFLPDRSSISILLGIKNGRVVHVAASHSPNSF